MLSYTSTFIVYLIATLIIYVFYSRVAEKKMSTPLCLLTGFLLYELLGASVNMIFSNSTILNTVTGLFINILFGLICFKIKLNRVIFYSVVLDILSGTLEYVVIFTISAVLKVPTTVYNDNIMMLFLIVAASKTMYFLVILIISKAAKIDSNEVKMPRSFYIFPASVFFSMMVFWYICQNNTVSAPYKVLASVSCALLCISAIVLFIAYQNNIERENENITLKKDLDIVKAEEKNYDLLEKKNEQLMIYAHDAKNHLTAIKNLNNNKEIAEYIDRMTESLTNYSNVCHSSNKMIDAIVNRYITECEMKHIDFTYDVKLCDLSYIENTDIVAILSNLMNNAVESAEKADGGFISFAIDRRNRFEVLVIKNSCTEKPDKKDGVYLSSKNDKENHGLGLRSITQTVQKYGGDFYNEYDEDKKIFISTVIVRRPITDETEEQ